MSKFECKNKINIVSNCSALGDTIATLPTIKLLSEKDHINKLFVLTQFKELYEGLDIPFETYDDKTDEKGGFGFDTGNWPTVYTLQPKPSSIHMHLVDCFSSSICDVILNDNERNYPQIKLSKLPKNEYKGQKYVVIAYGSTVAFRKMLPETFNQIKEWLIKNGYEVILLGREYNLQVSKDKFNPVSFSGANFSGCINLINKTTLLDALSIISNAELFIGLDSGLCHLAGMTEVKIVSGYTSVSPFYRMPIRFTQLGWNCWPVEPISECRYCQTNTFCNFGIDFSECQIKTMDCNKSLSFELYLEQIQNALNY